MITPALQQLRELVHGPDQADPGEALLELAKTITAPVDVQKRRTPDGAVSLALSTITGVDHDYQRPPDRDTIASMVEHRRAGGTFKPIKVNVRPDGTHWITDGQHRAAAAAIVGDTHIDAKLTHVPQQDEPAETSILTKIAPDSDLDAISLMLGHGARLNGKRLVLKLGRAGHVTYVPRDREYAGQSERGVLRIDAEDARDIAKRLEIDTLTLENGGLSSHEPDHGA